MSTQITLTLPDPIYRQAQKVAQSTQRDVHEILTEVITRTFQPFPIHENREAMLREIEAYKALHPQLIKQFKGQYVAIHRGQVVDHDDDPVALHKRIQANYPDQVVLRRKVQDEAEPVLRIRSPRLVSNP